MSPETARVSLSSVKRFKLGSFEISSDIEPLDAETAAEVQTTAEDSRLSPRKSANWWWDKQRHPVLVEALVCALAVGLLVNAAADPHAFFDSAHGVGGFIAAVVLVAVIGRRAVRRVTRG